MRLSLLERTTPVSNWAHIGILTFKNLSGEGASYESVYDRLQYCGKGGTSPCKPVNELNQNIKKQSKLCRAPGRWGIQG